MPLSRFFRTARQADSSSDQLLSSGLGLLRSQGRAARAARADSQRPTLVVTRTHIGYGSPNKQDTAAAHGAPLGADEVDLTKKALGWPLDPPFHLPEEAAEAFAHVPAQGKRRQAEWRAMFERYRVEHPQSIRGDPVALQE